MKFFLFSDNATTCSKSSNVTELKQKTGDCIISIISTLLDTHPGRSVAEDGLAPLGLVVVADTQRADIRPRDVEQTVNHLVALEVRAVLLDCRCTTCLSVLPPSAQTLTTYADKQNILLHQIVCKHQLTSYKTDYLTIIVIILGGKYNH